ncbi:MAG: class I SAM-dependent methyltransferase [Bosea sp. (in: a-proteobacteria)]
MQNVRPQLPPEAFDKIDLSNDDLFYAEPRLVTHIDDHAVDALTRLYGHLLPPEGSVLDLMSSWVSHLPASFAGDVTGHGMNADELAANERLAAFFVQNLNTQPQLALDDASFDAALCCVGVQYLVRPDDVFGEVRRVLRPEAPFIISFSNRCFPTKAVAVWRALSAKGHGDLVTHYLHNAGFERIERHVLRDGRVSDPLTAVIGYR